MHIIVIIAQLVIALGILNVWLLRFGQSSSWRGGDATDMKQEFAVYGLPEKAVYIVGFFKLLFAVLLILGIWVHVLTIPAALGMAVLMLGAVGMHIKAGDAPKKSLPAGSVLILCLFVAIFA
jgi:hypothetical protein